MNVQKLVTPGEFGGNPHVITASTVSLCWDPTFSVASSVCSQDHQSPQLMELRKKALGTFSTESDAASVYPIMRHNYDYCHECLRVAKFVRAIFPSLERVITH